jgi:tetratricopeptide (TPR) repeat protein
MDEVDAMNEDEQSPESAEMGNFYFLVRWWADCHTQTAFSKRTGIPSSEISRYEANIQKPQAATERQLLTGGNVPERLRGFLRWCYRLMRQSRAAAWKVEGPSSQPRLSTDLRAAAWEAIERSLALAQTACLLHRSLQGGGRSVAPTAQDWQRVEVLFDRLKGHPANQQRLLLEASSSYRDPLLCLRLCRASESAAAHEPDEAMMLAETAFLVAGYLPETVRSRALGWCMGFIGNVQRVVGGDFDAADRSFSQAWRHWRLSKAPSSLFSEAYLLDMEASLRTAQRQFQRAMKLHADALALAQPNETGTILLNMAGTLQDEGKNEEALQTLARAAKAIDGERQPRLLYGALFNRASNLCLLGRAEEAAPLIPEVRRLSDQLGNGIDGIRTTWLEASCAAGLGRREEALAKLEEVRQAFAEKPLPFDYALASLDVALLYREEGRFPEIRTLAAGMLKHFKAQKVHRETIAAVILFHEAAEKERVTVTLVRSLKDYLAKASSRPGARFGG